MNVVSDEEGISAGHQARRPVVGGRLDPGPRVYEPGGHRQRLNVYFAGKTNFKPAAPDLRVLRAEILSPERTTSEEVGVKTNWLDNQVSFNMSFFHMIFNDVVVSIEGPDGQPELVNAGQELFQGAEFEFELPPEVPPLLRVPRRLRPPRRAVQGLHVHRSGRGPAGRVRPAPRADAAGPLEHGPRLRPPGRLRRLVRDSPPEPSAVRQDQHRLHAVVLRVRRRRLVHLRTRPRFSFVARNIGDSRHYVGESEIGDAQDYVAFPRRFWGEIAFRSDPTPAELARPPNTGAGLFFVPRTRSRSRRCRSAWPK